MKEKDTLLLFITNIMNIQEMMKKDTLLQFITNILNIQEMMKEIIEGKIIVE